MPCSKQMCSARILLRGFVYCGWKIKPDYKYNQSAAPLEIAALSPFGKGDTDDGLKSCIDTHVYVWKGFLDETL